MHFFDMDQFQEDLKSVLSKEDVDILVTLYDARRCQSPVDEVSKRLGITTTKVKQRTLKTIDLLRRMAGYAVLLERATNGADAEVTKPPSN